MTPVSPWPKKVVVVGGGPAGLQAAITAAERGHKVVLFERSFSLGGNLAAAAAPGFKDDLKRFLRYLRARVLALGVDVRMGTAANAARVMAERPDRLVIAVGAEPARPDIPGLTEARAVWAGDVCTGDAETGERVVVAGGGGIGCETALHLARQGKKVTVVEMLPEAALDFNFINRGMLLELLADAGVEIRTGWKVVEVRADGVTVEQTGPGGQPGAAAEDCVVAAHLAPARSQIPADTVVLALGMVPRSTLVEELKPAAPRVFVVGDCVKPRHIIEAVHEGFYSVVEL